MNDMERIQRGLEEFLQKQAEEQEYREDWDVRKSAGRSAGKSVRKSTGRSVGKSAGRSAGKSTGRPARSATGSGTVSRKRSTGGRGSRRESQEQFRKQSRRQSRKQQGRKKKRFSIKRFLLTAALIIALLAGGLYYVVGRVYSKLNYQEIESLTSAPMKEDGVINILLIGNDSRKNGEDGRSDAMILLSVSARTKKIYMTSLLRDMYVEIPGHDNNRLNAAYSFGGAELLMETVEQNLGITVNRYMLVNFEAFANLVDAVDGVDLELSSAEIEWVNAYLNEYNLLTEKEFGTDYMDTSAEGMVHLNGPQALAYTRNRYIGTDFGRTERQRKVLKEVIRKLPGGLVKNPGLLIDGLMPNLTTNLTQWECYQLSLSAPAMLTYDIEQGSIPLQDTYRNATIRKMAVLEVDFDANKKYLHELLFGSQED